MRNRIRKQILFEIKSYKGNFLRKELKEKVLNALEERGMLNKDENLRCFNEIYDELKSRNKFFYLSKESKRKLYIH